MRSERWVVTRLLAGGLALWAGTAGAETFWTTQYGKLRAFEVDFTTGEAQWTMQASGDVSGALIYFGVAREPATGALWVDYYDASNGRQAFGRLAPGAVRPEAGVELPPAYFGYHSTPKFSPDGTLYAVLSYWTEYNKELATIDKVTGDVEPILTFESSYGISDFAFEPSTGDLFLTGAEHCDTGCVEFLDRLTVPGHHRTRIASWYSLGPASPLFSASGDLLLMMGGFYRLQGSLPIYLSQQPKLATALGPFFPGVSEASPAEGTIGCVPSRTRACLQHRRFALDVIFDASQHGGPIGSAKPSLESDESVKFTFFAPENLEVFVKVLDGCGTNGHYWVFASGLTNLGVTLSVTDTVTGQVYPYVSPPGQTFASLLDIEAFPCTP